MIVFMCRHVYVYLCDCFMKVHTCTYCICMYVMTMYSAVRIPLVSNCAIQMKLLLLPCQATGVIGWALKLSGLLSVFFGEMENLTCNLYLSVAAHAKVRADPSRRYTSMLLGRSATNQHSLQPSLFYLPDSCFLLFASFALMLFPFRPPTWCA